jgi:uncharacterized protein YecE (DUF72 family)
MARLHIGLPSLQGDIQKYKDRFDLLELRPVDTVLPRLPTLRKWRKLVPPGFVFSVVLPRVVSELVPGPALDEALATSLEIAAVLEARCIVLATSASIRPTAANRKRIAQVFESIPEQGVVRCWEPAGIWEHDDVISFARSLGILPVLDAAREELAQGAVAYTRLRALGRGAAIGVTMIARVADRLRGRREVFVVVDSAGQARRIKHTLETEFAKGRSRSAPSAPARAPIASALVAEDEEQ